MLQQRRAAECIVCDIFLRHRAGLLVTASQVLGHGARTFRGDCDFLPFFLSQALRMQTCLTLTFWDPNSAKRGPSGLGFIVDNAPFQTSLPRRSAEIQYGLSIGYWPEGLSAMRSPTQPALPFGHQPAVATALEPDSRQVHLPSSLDSAFEPEARHRCAAPMG